METIQLSKWGTVKCTPPNMATCFEMVISWTNCGDDMAALARICAAAIGANITTRLPRYRPAVHKPSEYGHICLNEMLEAGIDTGTILRTGTALLQEMSKALPTADEVEDTANFLLEPHPED